MEHGDASCVLGADRPTAETTDQESDDPSCDEIAIEYRQPEPDVESLS
ncbi:MAG: hypothetical protein A07HN63_02487 [uncultured archaeon A07HN63]|nr:MAG: hypothetical protein A07HN63_02487 [uncultured archaeon A07HN63]